MGNEQNSSKKFLSFSLTIEDKVLVAVILSLLSIVVSVCFNVFYEPNWVKNIINTNNQIHSKIKNETIVLIGGGTVHEYFLENDVYKNYYKIADSTCLIPVRIPSLVACKTLKDESSIYNNTNAWIVMSSVRADAQDFMNSNEIDNFKKKKRIIEVFLKKDKLLVITTKDKIFDSFSSVEGKMNVDELKNIVSKSLNNNFDIFTTSEGSGTLQLYRNLLGESLITDTKSTKIFDLNTTYPEQQPYMILCSEIYKPKNYNYKNRNMYYIYNSKNEDIEKELYLYFNATYNENNAGKLDIPNCVMKFLKCAKPDFKINTSSQDELIIRDNSR